MGHILDILRSFFGELQALGYDILLFFTWKTIRIIVYTYYSLLTYNKLMKCFNIGSVHIKLFYEKTNDENSKTFSRCEVI